MDQQQQQIHQIDDGLQQLPPQQQQQGEQPPPIELDPAFGQDPGVVNAAANTSGEVSDDEVQYLGEAVHGGDLVFRPLPAEEFRDQQVLERAIQRRDELEDTENKDPNGIYDNNNVITEDDIVIIQLDPEDFEAIVPAPGPSNPPGNNRRRRPRSPGSPSTHPSRRMRM